MNNKEIELMCDECMNCKYIKPIQMGGVIKCLFLEICKNALEVSADESEEVRKKKL